MAIDARTLELIKQKASTGQKLSAPTADKTNAYNNYQKQLTGIIHQKAATGQKLSDPNAWKQSVYDSYKKPFSADDYMKQQQDRVNSMYDQRKNSQMAQFNAERDKALGFINQQKAQVAPEYANKRNQADVVSAQNVNKLREMMAANGISASGENVTANVALGSARQGALSQLNLQEQQTNNDFDRQITDINNPERINAMIMQLEAERAQALNETANRADDVGYSRERDLIGDQRYNQQFNYQAGRDKVGDNQWQQQFNYGKSRDAVGDSRWNQEFNQGNQRYAQEKAWREYTYKNMSAADKAQMSQNASQFGEEMAWKMYSQEYQGELQKSLSQNELAAYANGGYYTP